MAKLRFTESTKESIAKGIIITFLLLVCVILSNLINADDEKHIQKVSIECAKQGYGIIAKYGNDGEKYYVCNK